MEKIIKLWISSCLIQSLFSLNVFCGKEFHYIYQNMLRPAGPESEQLRNHFKSTKLKLLYSGRCIGERIA